MLAILFLAVVGSASAWYTPLVQYANGAAVPLDPNNVAATNAHLAAKGYGVLNAGYHLLGKREAEADPAYLAAAYGYGYATPLVAHYNGAVVPAEPLANVQARIDHANAKADALIKLGKREAEAEADPAYLGAYGYGAGLAYAAPVAPLVTHYNGAVTPAEPLANVQARINHFNAKLALGKREAEAEADPAYIGAYGYGAGLAYAAPIVSPLVAHYNGAVVPAEPLANVQARIDHLNAKAAILG